MQTAVSSLGTIVPALPSRRSNNFPLRQGGLSRWETSSILMPGEELQCHFPRRRASSSPFPIHVGLDPPILEDVLYARDGSPMSIIIRLLTFVPV